MLSIKVPNYSGLAMLSYPSNQVPAGDGNGIERSVFVNISSALLASLEVYDRECLLGLLMCLLQTRSLLIKQWQGVFYEGLPRL